MKRILILTLVFAIAFSMVAGVSAKTIPSTDLPLGNMKLGRATGRTIDLNFEIVPTNMKYFRGMLLYEGAETLAVAGKPQVPFYAKRVEIPNGWTVKDVFVTDIASKNYPLPNLDVYVPKTWSVKDLKVDFENEKTGIFPNVLGGFKVESGSKAQSVALEINPVLCDFDSKQMRIATNVTVSILLEESFEKFSSREGDTKKSVILCKADYLKPANRLADAHMAEKYEAEVVTLESIASKYSPQEEEPEYPGPQKYKEKDKQYMKKYDYDLAKKIRAYLAENIDNINYLTILGDGLVVPASFYQTERMYYERYDKYIPTDLFYSSPDLDTVPNIAVGRLPVRTVDEAEKLVSRIITYRKAITKEKMHSISFAGGDPFQGGFDGELDCQSIIEYGYADGMKVKKFYKTSGKFDNKSVMDALKSETGFIYSISHGSGDTVYTEPGKVTTADLMSLPKREVTPIIFTPSCTNGMYDASLIDHKYETKGAEGMSWGQACLLSEGGPIAYFGGSRINYAGVNWIVEGGVVKILPFTEMDRLMQESFASYAGWAETLGDMYSEALSKYIGISSGGFFQSNKSLFAYTLLGDPTIKLPTAPGGQPHKQPDIKTLKCPMTGGRFSVPIMSITDESAISVKTDAEWVKVKSIDLEDNNKSTEEKKISGAQDKSVEMKFKHDKKSFYQMRMTLPNHSEVWMYYISRANFDLSAESARTFYITEPGKTEYFSFNIFNDGVKSQEKIEIKFFLDDKLMETKKLKKLEKWYGEYVSFKLKNIQEGEHEVKLELSSAEKDQFPKDNIITKKLTITKKETAKGGIIISYFFNSSMAKEALGAELYNTEGPKLGETPTEIATIGSDSYMSMLFGSDMPDLANAGCDTIFCVTPNFSNPYRSSNYTNLRTFMTNGGQIVGFGCLYSAKYGQNYAPLAEIFGFKKDTDFEFEEDEIEVTYKNPETPHILFDKITDGIHFGKTIGNKAPNTGWESALDKAKPIAWSADKQSLIAENTKTIYISSIPEVKSAPQIQFLHNILMYNLRPQKEAEITPSDIEVLPPVLEVGGKGKVVCDVQNKGNIDLANVLVTLLPSGKTATIERIEKGKSSKVEFEIDSPNVQSVVNFKAIVKVEGDIDLTNNEVEVRVQAMEKSSGKEATITDLSIQDGQLLPYKPTFLEGKTQPNTTITANGYCARSDDKGRFSLFIEPTDTIPLSLSIKGSDGSMSIKNLFVSFEKGGLIGGTVDKKYLMEPSGIIENLPEAPCIMIDKETYLNLNVCQSSLNLKVEANGQNWTIKGQKFIISGSNDSKADLSVGNLATKIELPKAPIIKDGKLLVPFHTLQKLYFGIEQNNNLKSFKISFPVENKTSLQYSTSSGENSGAAKSDKLFIPSESDYGPAKLISYGALEGEVSMLNGYAFGGTKYLYLMTSRGLEKWTKDGKYEANIGYPKTLSKDLDLEWYKILFGSSYYRSTSVEFVATNDRFIFGFGEKLAFYDKDFNLVKLIENKDDGFNFYPGVEINSSGNICLFNGSGALLEYDSNGNLLKTTTYKDSEGEEIEYATDFALLPNGKTIILVSGNYWSLNWAMYLFDKDGNAITSKVVEGEIEDILDDPEKYELPPQGVMATQDGTIWIVKSGYSNLSVATIDESFKEIESKVISEGYSRFKSIALSPEGVFYLQGSFEDESDNSIKMYQMAYLDKDYKQMPIIPSVLSDSNDRFQTPYKLMFDPNGNLLLFGEDGANVYDKTGNYKEKLQFTQDKLSLFDGYSDISFDGENYVLLSEGWYTSMIAIADKDKKIFKTIFLQNEDVNFRPVGIASNLEKDEIYILDGSGQVYVISSYLDVKEPTEEVTIKRKIGSYGYGQGRMSSPSQMVKKGDKLYIMDVSLDKYLVFDTNGDFLFEFGGEGEMPGKFQYPMSVGVDENDLIWTIDLVLSKIQVFTPEGAYLATLGYEGPNTSPGSVKGYKENPFAMFSPIDLAIGGGQMAIFDYGHSRLYMVGSLERATNFTIMPPELSISTQVTTEKTSCEFYISNTGPGTLSYELSTEHKNVKITPSKFTGNFAKITLEIDLSAEKTETIVIKAKSNIGNSSIEIPIKYRMINAAFALEPVASNDSEVILMSRTPEIVNDLVVFSSIDIENLISLHGIIGKDTQTLYYTFKNRKIGFKINSSIAELIADGDVFNIDLGYKVSKLKDGGYSIPINVIASFLSCNLIAKGKTYKITSKVADENNGKTPKP